MDQHQPQNAPAATQQAPTVGPRVAAARSRKKRALIITAATGLALVVGGTATAAVIATGGGPGPATNATGVPEADPDHLVADDAVPEADEALAQRAEEATAAARQAASANGDDILEEPEETEEPEGPAAPSDGDAEPSGESGSCQASYYGADLAGNSTANGETFDPDAMTAAHKTLPFGTMVQVTNPDNGASVTVRINDRGPYIAGRCLDLSTAAFEQIIGTSAGVGQVDWQVVG